MKPFQSNNRNAIKMFIYRYGELVPYYNRTEEGSNRLNKPEVVFKHGGEALALRYNHTAKELELDMGEHDQYKPKFMVPYDSPIDGDAHIIYRGEEYELTVPENHGSYATFQSKTVNVLTNDNSNVTVVDEDTGDEIVTPVNIPDNWDNV